MSRCDNPARVQRADRAAARFVPRLNGAGTPQRGVRYRLQKVQDAPFASVLVIRIRCVTVSLMRTTLDIDRDVLEAAKEMASRTKRSAGQILSELARKALVFNGSSRDSPPTVLNGFEILPAIGRVVTPELVRKLMEESEQP